MTRKEVRRETRIRHKKAGLCTRCSRPAIICFYKDPKSNMIFKSKLLCHCREHFEITKRECRDRKIRKKTDYKIKSSDPI